VAPGPLGAVPPLTRRLGAWPRRPPSGNLNLNRVGGVAATGTAAPGLRVTVGQGAFSKFSLSRRPVAAHRDRRWAGRAVVTVQPENGSRFWTRSAAAVPV
jgi:hypothetical protein